MLGSGGSEWRKQDSPCPRETFNCEESQTSQIVVKYVTYKLWLVPCSSPSWSETELPQQVCLLPEPAFWCSSCHPEATRDTQEEALFLLRSPPAQDSWVCVHSQLCPANLPSFWELPVWWWQTAFKETPMPGEGKNSKPREPLGF